MSLLVLLLLLPPAGAVLCTATTNRRGARLVALVVSVATLVVAILATLEFRSIGADPKGIDYFGPGVPTLGFTFHLGVDWISLSLILLTVGLMPLAIWASFESI